MISGCRLASSATSGARWPGVSTQATASLRGAAAAPPAPAAIPARNAATILKTAALRIALSPLVRAFARVPVPPAAPSCHRTSLARAAALGENRLGAHQAPDMVDRLDKGAGSRQFGVFLVEADVDDLLDAPGTGRHHGDPLGEKDRFLHVVGDEDHGLARMLPDAQQLHLHQAAGLRVERAEGLVHQQDARIDGERAGDCRALLHAARELRGIAVLEPAETDEIDEGAGAPLALIPRYPLFFKTVKNILQNRLPGKQGKVLKDNATVGTGAGNRLAFDQDRAGLDRQKAADQIEQCALAAAARAEQRDELAVAHAERDVVERQDRAAARRPIDMADPVDDDLRRIRHDRALLCGRLRPRLSGAPPRGGTGGPAAIVAEAAAPAPRPVDPAARGLARAGAPPLLCPRSTAREPLPMRIHNLYTDASGQSHFRNIEVEWVEETRAGKLSKRLPATGIIFREVPPTYDLDWHPAPRRQYIINLDAGVLISASDGEARVTGAGEVLLVEDTTGQGHLSKAGDGKIRHCIFVPVE